MATQEGLEQKGGRYKDIDACFEKCNEKKRDAYC